MGLSGLKHTYAVVYGTDGNILTGDDGLGASGIYVSNMADQGTASANITNMGAAGTAKYGDDGMVGQTKSKQFPQVAVVWNDLPFDVKSKLLGQISDGKGGYVQSPSTTKTALIVETHSINRQEEIYFAFSSGEFFEPAANIQSDNQTVQEVTDALTFQSFGDDRWNGQGMKIYRSSETGFDKEKMFAEVFNGYKASTPNP